MRDLKIDFVVTVAGAGVVEPLRQFTADAASEGLIADARLDQREKSEGIDLRPVSGVERAAIVSAVLSVTHAVSTEAVKNLLAVVADRHVEVQERHDVALVGIAPMRVRLRNRVVAGVAIHNLRTRIGERAVGLITIAILNRR